jgi:hypothetical protein
VVLVSRQLIKATGTCHQIYFKINHDFQRFFSSNLEETKQSLKIFLELFDVQLPCGFYYQFSSYVTQLKSSIKVLLWVENIIFITMFAWHVLHQAKIIVGMLKWKKYLCCGIHTAVTNPENASCEFNWTK